MTESKREALQTAMNCIAERRQGREQRRWAVLSSGVDVKRIDMNSYGNELNGAAVEERGSA